MAHWWILIFIIALSKRATCNYECTKRDYEVTCSGINSDQLSQKVSVTLNKTGIVTLNITNGIMSTISPSTFKDFNRLETLYVTNCKVSNLEDNSISHSLDLTHLYLNNNSLTEFNVRALPTENGLNVLDLSYNHLNDLSEFNVSHFPKLTFLNLANNFLSYLPIDLLAKLKEENQFFLVADNNPWNCDDSNWSEYLTDKLIAAFCFNNTFDYTHGKTETITKEDITTKNTVDIQSFENEDSNNGTRLNDDKHIRSYTHGKTEPTTEVTTVTNYESALKEVDNTAENNVDIQDFENEESNNGTRLKDRYIRPTFQEEPPCSFRYCLYWFIGGVWIGIIVGNIPKIARLVCGKDVGYTDQYTQCEQSISEQYMVSGFRLHFNRDRQRDSTL